MASIDFPQTSKRVTYAFNAVGAQPISVTVVDALAPPSQDISPGASGAWYEVRDAQDRVLYARPYLHPLIKSLEVHGDDDVFPHRMHAVLDYEGSDSFLIPDFPDARWLVFFGPRRDGAGKQVATAASVELARIAID